MNIEKKKLSIVLIIVGIAFITLFYMLNNKTTIKQTDEEFYNSLLYVKEVDSLQKAVSSNLLKMKIKEDKPVETTFRKLTGLSTNKIFIVDRMVIDYSKPCDGLINTAYLVNKEPCQFALIEAKNKSFFYLRGSCDYDLFNLSANYAGFDKLYFNLKYPIEEIKDDDKLIISIQSKNEKVPNFFIEPKIHIESKIVCEKVY
jgi:hypothetical protein